MKQLIKDRLRRVFPILSSHHRALRTRYDAYKTLIADHSSYLYSSGWMESQKRGYPCRRDGSELPWMNHSVINFLEQRLNKELTLFEFGSGSSTPFYARFVNTVTSVECDEKWYEVISKIIPDNVKLLFKREDIDGDYCRCICEPPDKLYDVVAIDGRDRVNCLKQSIMKLSDKGVILLDDAQRERYSDGIAYAKGKGFSALDFEGLTSYGREISRTTIIYRPRNCLGI